MSYPSAKLKLRFAGPGQTCITVFYDPTSPTDKVLEVAERRLAVEGITLRPHERNELRERIDRIKKEG